MSYGILNGAAMIAKFIVPLTVKSNQPVFSSDTLSLSRVSVKRNVQRWEIDTNLEPLVGTANDLFAHLVTKGSSESFKIKMPQNYGAQLQMEKPLEITATLSKAVFTVSGSPSQQQITGVCFLRRADASAPPTPPGGSCATPTATGWSDGVPAGTDQLWQTTRVFTNDGLSPQADVWATPSKVANTSAQKFQFGMDNVAWEDAAATASLYMRSATSTDGGATWTYLPGMPIKGETLADFYATVLNKNIAGVGLITATDASAHTLTVSSLPSTVALVSGSSGTYSITETPTVGFTAKLSGAVFTVASPSLSTYASVLTKNIAGIGVITAIDAAALTLTVAALTAGSRLPRTPSSLYIDSETELIFGAAAAGVTSLSITSNINKKLPAGLFVTFGTDPKVYMVTSHTTTLNIFPELRLPVTTTTRVNSTLVEMRVKYDTDVISGMVYSDGVMMTTGQVKLIEAL